jgi:hypothetical protein
LWRTSSFHSVLILCCVPKQETTKFFSKHDDGIYVMKFLEIWDPMVRLTWSHRLHQALLVTSEFKMLLGWCFVHTIP